jgi:hypothetical protein
LGLGLFLGHVGALLDESPPSGPGTETAASHPPPAVPPKGPSPASPPGTEKGSPLGPPADLADAETRARLTVRLYLDLLDRPPTRDEIEKVSTFAHDRLWQEIVTKAGFRPGDGAKVFTLFLGRKPDEAAVDAVFAEVGRDMDHFAFRVGTSQDYASAGHRRKRSARQLSRSLIVDLLDVAPTSEVSAKVLGEIEDSKGVVAPAARALADSKDSRAGPRAGEAPDRWLVSAYERLLLRGPSAEEKRRGLETIAGHEGGWREVLADLAARDEYLKY